MLTAYLAAHSFEEELQKELKNAQALGRLFLQEGPPQEPLWAQDIWSQCEILEIESVKDAVKKLKERGPWWVSYQFQLHRRAALIQDQLPRLRYPPLKFLEKPPTRSLGSWCLLSPQKLLCSKASRSPFPLGEVHFEEDKTTPPSRAYLKLWELFTAYGIQPPKGASVIDMGSSPGGWTWVLQQKGCQVLSVDKAPLKPDIAKLPGITFLKKDAFKLSPEEHPADWLFSDVICYPNKLFEFLQPWIKSPCHLVCTIKFQGKTDYEALERFRAVPNSRILHLFHNKHEVTWIRLHAKN